VFVLSQHDETQTGIEEFVSDLASRGAQVILAGAHHSGALNLPTIPAHAAIEPMLLAQSFYRLANALALTRGRDPDRPPNLTKVTETL
jgi:glucosamine--fructose-6-phosphate aminotransferase (isomerizing)